MEQRYEYDFDRCISERSDASSNENTALKKLISLRKKKFKGSESWYVINGYIILVEMMIQLLSLNPIDAAKVTATTAALAGADGTVYTTVDSAVTSNDAAITTAALTGADGTVYNSVIKLLLLDWYNCCRNSGIDRCGGTVHNNVDVTSNHQAAATLTEADLSGTGFSTVADLLTTNAAVAPVGLVVDDFYRLGHKPHWW